jgi:hypothetical protein
MIGFLTDNPGVLLFLNCCLAPLILFGLGVAVGRFRPRFRLPFTLDRHDHYNEEL